MVCADLLLVIQQNVQTHEAVMAHLEPTANKLSSGERQKLANTGLEPGLSTMKLTLRATDVFTWLPIKLH